jgi:lactate permease
MTGPSLTVLTWLLAFSPLAVVLVLMVFFRWGGAKAGPAGWFTALTVGATVFKGSPELLAYSQLEAVLLTLYVLYIIWMALLLYGVVEQAGAIRTIGRGITRLTADRGLQLLMLAWAFGSFLQGVAGFGVPIAVVAPLLVGLGFEPVIAVAAPAIGHSWSVTFGDIASSFNALIAATGLSGLELAPWSAALLGMACLGCGVAVIHAYRSWAGLRRAALALLLVGVAMAGTQFLLAVNGLWNLAGFVAGMVGLASCAAVTRLPAYRRREEGAAFTGAGLPDGESNVTQAVPSMPLFVAALPYLLLIGIVAAAELWTPLHRLLNQVQLTAAFPAVQTGLGWVTAERMGRKISLFGHAGALLTYTSILSMLFYGSRGILKKADVSRILGGMVRAGVPSSIGIASMVGMALIMDRCGMTYTLAHGLSSAVGTVFPAISPSIGLLGAFMTGSNTNSNVVFAPLQKTTAELVGVSALVILGAQTAGGSLGSMIAPAKIIVGCSTAGLQGQEGQVLRRTISYALLIAAAVGLVAWLAA